MSIQDAGRSAHIAEGQAIAAVSIIQRRIPRQPGDKYEENLALAVANLSIAVKQMAEHFAIRGL